MITGGAGPASQEELDVQVWRPQGFCGTQQSHVSDGSAFPPLRSTSQLCHTGWSSAPAPDRELVLFCSLGCFSEWLAVLWDIWQRSAVICVEYSCTHWTHRVGKNLHGTSGKVTRAKIRWFLKCCNSFIYFKYSWFCVKLQISQFLTQYYICEVGYKEWKILWVPRKIWVT